MSCNQQENIPKLPEAVTNNAVALVESNNSFQLYTFNGLSINKTFKDIHNKGFRFKNKHWQEIKMPNSSSPVLASTAVTIGTNIYLIGGYTVASDHSEKSKKEVFKLNTTESNSSQNDWKHVTNMPIPVDDTVALTYRNRYIYLISGWYDKDNVELIQVYDTQKNEWFNASSYPAPGVFGHAGGIVDNLMIICDGVKVVIENNNKSFLPSPVCMKGVINPSDPKQIKWMKIPHHPNTAFYRMAATGYKNKNQVVFAGGSDNPYNFNGIGYNKIPSKPSDKIFAYDLNTDSWHVLSVDIQANMDHRSLLNIDDSFYIIGGMLNKQTVSDKVIHFKL